MFKDYLALTKPRIVSLLTFSGLGAYFAAGGMSFMPFLALIVSLACVAGSASTVNCYYDRRLDEKMERTADRPLPAGRLSSIQALLFANGLLLAGVVISALFLPGRSLMWLVLGFCAYVGLYTIVLKRRHWLGVVLGGSAGSFPVLAGWAVVQPVGPSALLMALFVFAWTPAHAWVLEFIFRDQYERAGIPTYPVVHSPAETGRAVLRAALFTVACAAPLVATTGPFYIGLFLLASPLFLLGYLPFYKNPNRSNAVLAFFTANLYLTLLFLGWAIDGFFQHPRGLGFWVASALSPLVFVWMWRARPSLRDVTGAVPPVIASFLSTSLSE